VKAKRLVQLAVLVSLATASTLWLCAGRFASGAGAADKDGFTKRLDVRERAARTHQLTGLATNKLHSLLVSLPAPASLGERDGLTVTLRDGERVVASKTLHQGDADLYTLFRASGQAQLQITSNANQPIEHTITVLEWPENKAANASLEAEPNDTWQTANEIELGQTVWASADDKPYILPLGQTEVKGRTPYQLAPEATQDRLPDGGIDWFKLNYNGEQPRLVHFELELLERDNIPVDVSVFTVENNEVKPYERGIDTVSPPHEVQAVPGNKFTTRVLTKGTYYVRVDANHAFYQLRTASYDLPPYDDPRQAVRAGMDYIISAGDSWHANTPRHGGIVNRVSSNHHETQLCISCHATHFPTRAELIAQQNGYAVNKRSSLQFLVERLANNPRPFYGFPDAYWTNVISASANVMSRLAILVNTYDQEFTGEKRVSLLKGAAGYLKLYYKGRTALPNDESNGNTPLVSTYEVAWYSWRVFDELVKLTNDGEAREYRDLIRTLIEQDKLKNNVDLCYQTMAFATIDKQAYAERIKRNAERILSLQRADGQWSMLFDPTSASVEFQTYHCLYTLALAGYRAEHPQVAKALKFLLARQQPYGGWYDVKQSYENFGTPFRETQFAVMALSEFYKGSDGKGWQTKTASKGAGQDALARLQQFDDVWRAPSAAQKQELLAALNSAEPLLRMTAAAALGRVAAQEAVTPLRRLLGDRSKLVQIAAAQALRRIASVQKQPPKGGTPNATTNVILGALAASDARTRWAATRVFAQHFAYLTDHQEYADKLIALLADSFVPVRMQAAKSLVRWFYYAKDETLKDRIADAFVARMAQAEHPWVRRNLLEGFYSLADDNVRYLYNNWIGYLPQQADKDQATRGHHETSRRMAERIARALEAGNESQREGLLRGLTEFHLRHGGYSNAGRYTRIGNDIEQIVFYAEGAPALERALKPFITAPDAKRRQQAVLASYTLRDNTLVELPLLVMQRLNDPDAGVRAVSNEFYKSLPLKVVEQNRREAVAVLRELLASQYNEAQVAALERLKSLGDFARREKFDEDLRRFLLRADSVDKKTAAAALRAVGDFPQLAADAAVQQRIATALQSSDNELLRAAIQLVLLSPSVRGVPALAAALDSVFKTESAARRKLVLDLVTPEAQVENDLRLISLIADALEASDESVRIAALNAVRRIKALHGNAAIRAELARMAKDKNPRLQSLALSIYQGQQNAAADLRAEALLDFNFFVARIMPILTTKGADGNACVNCHTTHAIFQLVAPDNAGRFSEAALRDNYRSALRVVDLANPENSLILRKPIGDASQEGLIDAKKTPHGGGLRWQGGAGDAAYETVMEWINGARLSAAKGTEK
jgi:hypothetical protein